MRTKLFFILLAVAWSMNASAQTIKTYSGGMKAPKDAYFAIGEDGNGSYQYYEKDGKRVKHGFFRFTNKYCSITGQFVHGCKQGSWNFQRTRSHSQNAYVEVKTTGNVNYRKISTNYVDKKEYSTNEQCTMTFKNDLPNGRYQCTCKSYYFEGESKSSTYTSASATLKNGILSGTFTMSYSHNGVNPDKWTANCAIDSNGRANGIWTINYESQDEKSVSKFEFCHGMHIRTSKYDDSTGDDKVLYIDDKYDKYKRLSKIECDTLVKGAGHCLLDGDMLYKREFYHPELNSIGYWCDLITDGFVYIDFEHVFCTWSAYKTITQVAAERQRILEDIRILKEKQEEEKRILKEKQEEEARRIAEAQKRAAESRKRAAESRKKREEAKVANAPLLKQVADNNHKIDSIYRKKNKPFFYNISSEYIKPIIYNRYKCCCKMDSCDVASIKEVLHLQDVIMKLRYMKTKKVEKQLKGGYTGETKWWETKEDHIKNVEKFYKDFFINEALNLAQ